MGRYGLKPIIFVLNNDGYMVERASRRIRIGSTTTSPNGTITLFPPPWAVRTGSRQKSARLVNWMPRWTGPPTAIQRATSRSSAAGRTIRRASPRPISVSKPCTRMFSGSAVAGAVVLILCVGTLWWQQRAVTAEKVAQQPKLQSAPNTVFRNDRVFDLSNVLPVPRRSGRCRLRHFSRRTSSYPVARRCRTAKSLCQIGPSWNMWIGSTYPATNKWMPLSRHERDRDGLLLPRTTTHG